MRADMVPFDLSAFDRTDKVAEEMARHTHPDFAVDRRLGRTIPVKRLRYGQYQQLARLDKAAGTGIGSIN